MKKALLALIILFLFIGYAHAEQNYKPSINKINEIIKNVEKVQNSLLSMVVWKINKKGDQIGEFPKGFTESEINARQTFLEISGQFLTRSKHLISIFYLLEKMKCENDKKTLLIAFLNVLLSEKRYYEDPKPAYVIDLLLNSIKHQNSIFQGNKLKENIDEYHNIISECAKGLE